MTNALLAQAQASGETTDQSVAQKGPVREITPAGVTPCRFVSYVETGSHMAYHEGKPTKNKEMVRGKFELLGKKHRNEFTNEAGETKVFYNTIEFGMGKDRELPLSSNEKAGFYKLFKKMDAGRGKKHMAEMLGEPFLIEIVHTKSPDGKQTYANMKKDGEWTVRAPFLETVGEDGEMETKALAVPEATLDLQFMDLNNPHQLQWDSIFIDGEYERTIKEEGKEDRKETVSKNFLQNRILASANFEGSKLQEILGGIDGIAAAIEESKPEAPEVLDEPETPAEQDAVETPEENNSGVADPLAALGF